MCYKYMYVCMHLQRYFFSNKLKHKTQQPPAATAFLNTEAAAVHLPRFEVQQLVM